MIGERPTVHTVLNEIRLLSAQEQLDLIDEITILLRSVLTTPPTRSILELSGLGKQIWQGVRAQEYVAQERAAWDG